MPTLSHATAALMKDHEDIRVFLEADRPIFTLVSKKSGTRFTFKGSLSKDGARRFWSVLNGADNGSDYLYLGYSNNVAGGTSRLNAGAKGRPDAPAFLALAWFLRAFWTKPELVDPQLEFWHAGRCCRCARLLTVPSSIANGVGPECATKL